MANLFPISFFIFWNSINVAYVLQLGNKVLVSDHIFTSQRESHAFLDTGFLLVFNYFVPFGLLRIGLPKLMEYLIRRWWYCQ